MILLLLLLHPRYDNFTPMLAKALQSLCHVAHSNAGVSKSPVLCAMAQCYVENNLNDSVLVLRVGPFRPELSSFGGLTSSWCADRCETAAEEAHTGKARSRCCFPAPVRGHRDQPCWVAGGEESSPVCVQACWEQRECSPFGHRDTVRPNLNKAKPSKQSSFAKQAAAKLDQTHMPTHAHNTPVKGWGPTSFTPQIAVALPTEEWPTLNASTINKLLNRTSSTASADSIAAQPASTLASAHAADAASGCNMQTETEPKHETEKEPAADTATKCQSGFRCSCSGACCTRQPGHQCSARQKSGHC